MQPEDIPPRYVPYPREKLPPDAAVRLRAIGDVYFGLSEVLGLGLVVQVCASPFVFIAATGGLTDPLLSLAGVCSVSALVVGIFADKKLEPMAHLGWSRAACIGTSVLLGLQSILCFGILGIGALQSSLHAKMTRDFGVKGGIFGIQKKHVAQRVEELLRMQDGAPPLGGPPGTPPSGGRLPDQQGDSQ